MVIGSGIAARRLSPTDTALQLLQNSITTVFGLGVLILVLGPVSGAHFNPVVSAVDWLIGRRDRTGLSGTDAAALANLMFDLPALQVSSHVRSGAGLWIGEVVATAGLIAVVLALHPDRAPAADAVVVPPDTSNPDRTRA